MSPCPPSGNASDVTRVTQAGSQIPDSHRDLAERPLYAQLATVRADGAPLVNPMWFLWDSETDAIKLTHTTTRHNYRNVRREPRVALMITDPNEPLRYMQIQGVVETIEPDPTGAFYEILQRRYTGQVGEVGERAERVILVIRPTRVVTGAGIRERRHAERTQR